MNFKKLVIGILFLALTFSVAAGFAHADSLKIAIMQDKKGAAKKFQPLVPYFKTQGVDVSFVGAKNYAAAAQMFASGKVDAMFSGSGVAGSMIIKEVAQPLVRPVSKSGTSTYWAVVIAPKGSPRFTQNADYFKGKKVIFCSLASSGEFYFRSIEGATKVGAEMKKAASHGAAVDALSKGAADVAIVKNLVWDKIKDKYPDLARVGEDPGENPNGTLIVSKKMDGSLADKVKSALLAMESNSSVEAKTARDGMKVRGYLETSVDDFKHTIPMLKKAGVDKSFNFKY